LAAVLGQHLGARPYPLDAGRPDEDHLELTRIRAELRRSGGLERLSLAAVGVAHDGDVDEPERELLGALDLSRQQDEARARSKDRLAGAVELFERRHEVPRVDELEQGRGLTTWHDEPIDLAELDRLARLDRLDAALLERPSVEREVTLEGEHADPHRVGSPRSDHRLASPAAAARPTTPGSGADPSPPASRSRSRPWRRRDPRSPARARQDP